MKDTSGNTVGIVEAVLDITEHKRAEEELRKHREHLEELVEERTTELKRINEQLQKEIEERKRAEEALRESKETPLDSYLPYLSIRYAVAKERPLSQNQ